MIVWFGLIAYIFIVKLALKHLNTEGKKKRFLIIAGIGIALIMGLRGDNYANVYDLRVYKDYFSMISQVVWQDIFSVSEFEPGFAILNKLLSVFINWDQAIVLFEACFCVFAVLLFIYKNTKYVFEATLFFVTLGAMGFILTGFRQSIAIAICLLSVELIKKKKFIPFCVAVIIAVSIHKSSLVFAVAYFILNFKPLKKKRWLNILLVIGMMLFSSILLKLGNIFSSGEISSEGELLLSFNGIVPFVIYAVAIIFQIFSDKHHDDADDNSNGMIATMTSIGFGLYYLRFYLMIFERIAFYYSYSHIVSLTSFFEFVDKQDRNIKMLIRLIIYVLSVALFYHRLKTSDYGNYVFFWQ